MCLLLSNEAFESGKHQRKRTHQLFRVVVNSNFLPHQSIFVVLMAGYQTFLWPVASLTAGKGDGGVGVWINLPGMGVTLYCQVGKAIVRLEETYRKVLTELNNILSDRKNKLRPKSNVKDRRMKKMKNYSQENVR